MYWNQCTVAIDNPLTTVPLPYLLQSLDDLAGHGSNVRPSVSLDLRHISHTSDGEPEVL